MSDAPGDQPAPQPLVESADYLRWSQTPAAGLLFLLPWLGLYELAILTGSDPLELRNPAEPWLQVALRQAGGHYPWLLPVVVAGSLLIWHGVVRYRQGPAVRVDSRGTLLAGMLSESAFLAALLVFAGQFVHAVASEGIVMSLAETPRGPGAWAAACLGAGIYEEVLFRLWAIPAVVFGLRLFLVPTRIAVITSLIGTSLLFAAAHYSAAEWQTAGALLYRGFAFRTVVGVCFAMLFWFRGFGVAVGTHVLYDAIIVMITAVQQPA